MHVYVSTSRHEWGGNVADGWLLYSIALGLPRYEVEMLDNQKKVESLNIVLLAGCIKH